MTKIDSHLTTHQLDAVALAYNRCMWNQPEIELGNVGPSHLYVQNLIHQPMASNLIRAAPNDLTAVDEIHPGENYEEEGIELVEHFPRANHSPIKKTWFMNTSDLNYIYVDATEV